MNSETFASIQSSQNFVFEAGPGSGKTRSLIETLKQILKEPGNIINTQKQKIACITFTNVAANEITERLDDDSNIVHVSTIHSFLWNQISRYQSELRYVITNINDDPSRPEKKFIANLDLNNVEIRYVDGYADLTKGEISHDDLLDIAYHMFKHYPALGHLTRCRYPIIFLDEYQDTQPIVIDTLKHISKLKPGEKFGYTRFLVGLFGDSMQSIYNSGIGNVDPADLEAVTITKTDNHRSTGTIVNLINAVRARSKEAMPVIQTARRLDQPSTSQCSLYYTTDNIDVTHSTLESISEHFGWTLGMNTKILELTHSAISRTAGWNSLHGAINDRSRYALDDFRKGDDIYFSIFSFLTRLYRAWSADDGFEALNILRFHSPGSPRQRNLFGSSEEMQHWSSLLDEFTTRCSSRDLTRCSISSIMNFAWDNEICKQDFRIAQYLERTDFEKEEHKARRDNFIQALEHIPFSELLQFSEYLNQTSPFSTEHGTKGAEYDNVILIIDDNTWKQQYRVSTLFGSDDHIDARIERTLRLFYVAISRARNNLVVIYKNPTADSIAGAEELFGTNNVQPLEDILPDIAMS
jgi:DNA helicase II